MDVVTLDFETYFDSEYSLKKMAPLLYIRDAKFKVHGAALKVNDEPAYWVTGLELPREFDSLGLDKCRVVSHNSNFDLTILHEKYGVSPAERVDTIGLCRALLPRDLSFDLGSIAPLLGLGDKGDDLKLTKGVWDLSAETEAKLAAYAVQDAELEYGIYQKLWPSLPDLERRWMNLVLRMSTEGTLVLDRELALEAAQEIEEDRQHKLVAVGVTPTELRSREKFAGLLRSRGVEPPMKENKNGDQTYAFSKQDAEFVKLLADPRCADLIKAKMVWASNNEYKRVHKLVDICDRAPYTLPVQLNYSGAHTGRLSGGGNINMQNLNRGSKLRLSVCAPKNHVIVVADSSQIELRTNMWFCGQNDVLNILRSGGDVYKQMASRLFSKLEDRITKDERFIGKVTELGCFAGHTKVLTTRGWVSIKYLQPQDRLWDGDAWVSHNGVVRQGWKKTIEIAGVRATPDHRILLSDGTWVPFQKLGLAENGTSALEMFSKNLPSQGFWSGRGSASKKFWCSVRAVVKSTTHTPATWLEKSQTDATNVRKSKAQKPERNITGTQTLFRTTIIERGFSTGFLLACKGAITQTTKTTKTMARAVSKYATNGDKTKENFLNTSLRWKGGITQIFKWIESTTTSAINRATSGLLRTKPTQQTKGPWQVSGKKSNSFEPVYDILNSGLNHRFTILTDQGPVIAHNCGYQLGAVRYQAMMAAGPFGSDPIYLTQNEARSFIYTYRDSRKLVVDMWEYLNSVGIAALEGQISEQEQGPILIKQGSIVLPSGYELLYPNVTWNPEEESWGFGLDGPVRKLYGGILLENCIQSLAGLIIKEQILNIEDELNDDALVVHQVHDEALTVCPESHADDVLAIMQRHMSVSPDWAKDLPLASEGGYDRSYSK